MSELDLQTEAPLVEDEAIMTAEEAGPDEAAEEAASVEAAEPMPPKKGTRKPAVKKAELAAEAGSPPEPPISLRTFVRAQKGQVGPYVLFAFQRAEERAGRVTDTESAYARRLRRFLEE